MTYKRRVRREGETVKKPVPAKVQKAVTYTASKTKTQFIGFLDFIRSQSVVGLAVGIILGTSVTAAARSLVDDIFNPFLGLLIGSDKRFDQATIQVSSATVRWGNFISSVIDLLLVALVVYLTFKLLGLDKLDKKKTGKS